MPDSSFPLVAWTSFYTMMGSSAAGLTGLMFVVISLMPESRPGATGESLSAFGTPTVVHLCGALLVSALLCAPWTSVAMAGATVGLVGLSGVIYVCIVVRRANRQHEYRPVFEDWLWHACMPGLAYATLVVSWLTLALFPHGALFGFGGATILVLFIGIHNAWTP